MAKTSHNERIILNCNENNHSQTTNSNRKTHQSEDIDIQIMLRRLQRALDRQNTFGEISTTITNPHRSCQNHCCHQLEERVRELEQLTPCSNISGGSFPSYSRPQNFPMNLLSPNSSVATQPFGLSPKILERAHQIPERFWIDWQQKQMQNNLISPDKIDDNNRRKSLLLLHELQRRLSVPQAKLPDRTIFNSIETETSSSPINEDYNSFNFDQQSINKVDTSSTYEPLTPKSPASLDRSRLTIYIPFSHRNLPQQCQSREKSIETTISTANSIEDVAQIDTELKLTFLSRENVNHTNLLLYSSAILNRSIVFRSSSKQSKS